PVIANACGDDIVKLARWKQQMKNDIQAQSTDSTFISSRVNVSPNEGPSVQPLSEIQNENFVQPSIWAPEESLSVIKADNMTFDQKRAFDIIIWHLDQTLLGRNPPPLRMVIYGEGGTGK